MSSLLDDSSIAPTIPDAYRDRRPPWSEDAEQAVLGAMIMDRDAILRAAEHTDDTMFYREGHRRIFRAIIALNERGAVVDTLTLADELALRGELDAAGGKDYLSFLLDAVPTSANVEYHARIVREKALIRRVIETSTRGSTGGAHPANCSTSPSSASSRSARSTDARASIASRNSSGSAWNASSKWPREAAPLPVYRVGSPNWTSSR